MPQPPDEIANRTVLPEELRNIAAGLALRARLAAAIERVERLEEYAAKVATAGAWPPTTATWAWRPAPDRTALAALDEDADGLPRTLKEAVASGLPIGSR
jgi:hypothetical protein